MAAELDSSKIRDVAAVQDHLVQDHVRDLVPDPVVDRAPAQGIIVVLDPDQGTVGATSPIIFFCCFFFCLFIDILILNL